MAPSGPDRPSRLTWRLGAALCGLVKNSYSFTISYLFFFFSLFTGEIFVIFFYTYFTLISFSVRHKSVLNRCDGKK